MKLDISTGAVPSGATLSSLIGGGLQRVARAAERWQRRSAELRELEALLQDDGHLHRDLGITRTEIEAEIASLRGGLLQGLGRRS